MIGVFRFDTLSGDVNRKIETGKKRRAKDNIITPFDWPYAQGYIAERQRRWEVDQVG
jgi:hypothetical protein